MQKSTKSLRVKLILGALGLTGIATVLALGSRGVEAQNTAVSIFLTNTRYSFLGKLAPGNTTAGSLALIKTTQDPTNNIYSISSSQLQSGDQLRIGSNTYYVATTSAIMPDDEIALDRPMDAGDTAEDTQVSMIASGTLNIGIKTAAVADITNGSLQILVPAWDNTMVSDDNAPDPGFFDYGMTPQVICPADANGVTFQTPIASASASMPLIGGSAYHSFTCPFTGTLVSGSDFGFSANTNGVKISGLINPAPQEGHEIGMVELNTFIVRELNSAGTPVSNDYTMVGVVEAVKAVVSVAPQITFKITGVDSGALACNGQVTTNVTTDGVAVPFGEISPMMFTNAAQHLSISTNAAHGYAITVAETDQLSFNGDGCPATNTGMDTTNCINDFIGNNMAGGSDEPALDNPIAWTDSAIKGFGYTIGTPTTTGGPYVDANGVSHQATSINNWNVSNGYKKFADQSATGEVGDAVEYPRIVMQNTNSTNEDTVDFCYQITPSANLVPGDYFTNILFTATATF